MMALVAWLSAMFWTVQERLLRQLLAYFVWPSKLVRVFGVWKSGQSFFHKS